MIAVSSPARNSPEMLFKMLFMFFTLAAENTHKRSNYWVSHELALDEGECLGRARKHEMAREQTGLEFLDYLELSQISLSYSIMDITSTKLDCVCFSGQAMGQM